MGILKQGTTVTIQVQNVALERVAVTVLKVSKQDKIAEAEPSIVSAATSTAPSAATISTAIGGRIDRMIVLVDPPAGGRANVTFNSLPTVSIDGDTQFTFDCEP